VTAYWKSILTIYNLFLVAISALIVALALGYPEPWNWINQAFGTLQNRWISGGVGVLLAATGIGLMVQSFKTVPETEVVVQESSTGQVVITIPAIKQIVLKAVKLVEGVREARPEVKNSQDGVVVSLALLVNPDYKIPEMTASVQEKVRTMLEEVGGLRVAEVRIKVDDFASKPAVR